MALEWGREPWDGRRPRVLTTGYSYRRFAKAARPEDKIYVADPAQFTFFLKGKS